MMGGRIDEGLFWEIDDISSHQDRSPLPTIPDLWTLS